jgi:hypothetical protein
MYRPTQSWSDYYFNTFTVAVKAPSLSPVAVAVQGVGFLPHVMAVQGFAAPDLRGLLGNGYPPRPTEGHRPPNPPL